MVNILALIQPLSTLTEPTKGFTQLASFSHEHLFTQAPFSMFFHKWVRTFPPVLTKTELNESMHTDIYWGRWCDIIWYNNNNIIYIIICKWAHPSIKHSHNSSCTLSLAHCRWAEGYEIYEQWARGRPYLLNYSRFVFTSTRWLETLLRIWSPLFKHPNRKFSNIWKCNIYFCKCSLLSRQLRVTLVYVERLRSEHSGWD